MTVLVNSMNLENVLGQVETYHRDRHVPPPLSESHTRSCDQAATWESRAVHPNMTAPTNAAYVKKVLANSEPSTHGPERRLLRDSNMSGVGDKAEVTGLRSKWR
jgi:hypothetical protein